MHVLLVDCYMVLSVEAFMLRHRTKLSSVEQSTVSET